MISKLKKAITVKKALLILAAILLVTAGIVGYMALTDTDDLTEGSAESDFREQMADAGVTKIKVDEDLVLESPVEVKGTKVLYGKGSITAVGDGWASDAYMIRVPSGANLTVKGEVSVDADGKAGGIHAAQGAVWSLEETACVKNASAQTANTLVEGVFTMNGGTLSGAMGHNVYNAGEVTVSDGEIIGSGSKCAGIYSQGMLTQNGGTVRDAYNNVAVISGSFRFNGGTNRDSVRDGIYTAEGTKLEVTAKSAVITGSGVRGIYLCGEATVDGMALSSSGDTLLKISRTGKLDLNGGTLSDSGYHSIENAGKLVMTGGTISNSYNCGIVNTGELEITGGTFLDNTKNKAVLNKHNGKAIISGQRVMFSGNRYAVANEDTATLELTGAEVLLTTVTNVYAYDGTVNIHDISLGASGSNNVRIYKADVTMNNVQVLGNSSSGSSTTHGILLEGGKLEAKDLTVKNTTGYGIRNKGGEVTAENLLISKSLKAGGINNTLQDHTGAAGAMDIKNLTVEQIRYNNLVVEAGTLTITNGQLMASGTNNTKITDGTLNLKDVEIHGNLPDMDGTNHAVYSTGGTLVMENVKIRDAKVTGLRVNGQTAVITGKNVTIENNPKYGIDLTVGKIDIDGLTMQGNHYNITTVGGSINLRNSNLGATVSNNVRINENGAVNLQNVVIKGHTPEHPDNVHALFLDNGTLTGGNITVENVANAGLRVKAGTAKLQGLTVNDAGADGVWISGGKATIHNLTVKKAGSAGISATNNADITVIGGSINNTVSHGVKSEGEAKVALEDIAVSIATTKGRHAVLAQGGDVQLRDVKITGLASNTTGFGIRINKDTSHVSGSGVHIADVDTGINASAGTCDISGVTTENMAAHSVYAANSAKLVLSDSTFGISGTNNVKAEKNGTITLKDSVILGTKSNHGVIVENDGWIYGENLTVRDTKGVAVRVVCSPEGSHIEIDGLTTENIGAQNVYISSKANGGSAGSIVVKNADLGRTGTHSVRVDAGTLTLVDSKIQGHLSDAPGNVHGVYVCEKAEKVSLEGVTVLDSNGDALRIAAGEVMSTGLTSNQTGRYGIWADGGKLTAQNTTVSGSQIGVYATGGTMVFDGLRVSDSDANNIQATGGELTVNGYADGSRSQIGTSTEDNVKATDQGIIRLNKVDVAASAKNNVVAIEGGTVYLTDTAVTGGKHSVLADKNGKVYLEQVRIADSVTSGIRANHSGSHVEAQNVMIDGANTGLSIKCGSVQISDITVKNTKAVAVDVRQGDSNANVTLNNLVTENCGTHAIYTSGAAAILTVNGATLANDGSDHVIYLNGGPMALNDVAVNATADQQELYSGAGWLTVGGEMDVNVYIATDPGRVIKVNKELTGNGLVVDWKIAPTGNALAFAGEAMMNASADNITLGKTQADAGKQLQYQMDDTKAVAVLFGNLVRSEAELNQYLEMAAAKNMADVQILIGASFTVSEQVTIPACITQLSLADDGDTATGNTVTYSGSTDGLFVMHSDLKLTVRDISLASTQKVLLKQTGGTTELNDVTLSGKTSNIYVTDGTVTVNGGQIGTSTSDNVRAEGDGVITLNDVQVLAAGANNVVAINGGTIHMTDSSVTGGNHSVLADKDGKVTLNNVSITNSKTSGIRANHAGSHVQATGVTIDGAKTGMSIARGNVQITDITIRNTTETGVSVAQSTSDAKVTLNNLATENCGTHAIYTSGAAAMLTVNGATLANDGSDHIINLNGGPMALNDVAINGENLASNRYELYSGAGWLTVGGEMDVNVYIATDPGRVIKVNKELTGNDLVVDWKNAPTGNALEFASEAMLNASRDNITLGSIQGASKTLAYAGKVATLELLKTYTTVSSWDALSAKVSAMTSGSYEEYRIAGNASDWTANASLTVPEGVQVKLSADENSPAVVVASGVSPFTLGADTMLTLDKLVVGGTAEAKAAHIIVPKTATLTLNDTTLQYFEGQRGGAVHVNCGTLRATGSTFANNSNPTNWGGAIGIWGGTVNVSDTLFTGNTSKNSGGAIINYKADGSSYGGTTDGSVGDLTLKNCVFTANSTQEHGGAIASWANGTTTITDCVFGAENDAAKGNSVAKNGGAIQVLDGHTMTITNSKFYNNSTATNGNYYGGAIYTKSSVQVKVTGCTFAGNTSKYGGAVNVEDNAGGGIAIDQCVFKGNKAQVSGGEGGALRVATLTTVSNCSFESNVATGNGGAILLLKNSNGNNNLVVRDTTFTGNSGAQGGAISVATGCNMEAHNVECVNNTTTGAFGANTTWGFGDIRIADNTAAGQVRLSGKIVASIWNNQAHSVKVVGTLAQDSNVTIDWRLGKLSANEVGIVFDSQEAMNASKGFIHLGVDAATTEGWQLRYSTAAPWQASFVEAQ